MLTSKLFDPDDYKQPLYAEIRRYCEAWWYILALEKRKFSYSDRNRAWEYAQVCASIDFQGKHVLDLGTSGSLAPLYLARKLGCEIVTLDREWERERRRLYRAAGVARAVKVDVGDMLKPLPYEDGAFDVVTSWSVLEHLPEHAVTAAEIKRVCKPGGSIGLTVDFGVDTPETSKSGVTFDRVALQGLIDTFGLPFVGESDYDNVDLSVPRNRAVKGEYTFASIVLQNGES